MPRRPWTSRRYGSTIPLNCDLVYSWLNSNKAYSAATVMALRRVINNLRIPISRKALGLVVPVRSPQRTLPCPFLLITGLMLILYNPSRWDLVGLNASLTTFLICPRFKPPGLYHGSLVRSALAHNPAISPLSGIQRKVSLYR